MKIEQLIVAVVRATLRYVPFAIRADSAESIFYSSTAKHSIALISMFSVVFVSVKLF